MKNEPTNFEAIRIMKNAFGQPVPTEVSMPEAADFQLSMELIAEEFKEVMGAYNEVLLAREEGNQRAEVHAMEHLAKEFGDLLVVTYGGCATFGMDADAIMGNIFTSNMSKCVDGKVVRDPETNKVLKGENYQPADMSVIWETKLQSLCP